MTGAAITCPKCQNTSPGGAAFCGHCGADVRQPAAVEKKTMFGYRADMLPGLVADAAKEPPAPAAPAAPQTVAGRYTLADAGKTLPVGQIYRAEDSQTKGPVEVLLVDSSVFPSPLDLERARRELRQLQKVDSSNIAKVLDHGKEGEQLYVAMEPFEGQPLDAVVAAGAMPLVDAARVLTGIGQGLAEAQKVGVIHRDLAPHNVLVGPDGGVCIRGFGVAPPIKRNVFGTPEYVSPEQAAGRPVDQRSNIYSLGSLLFLMLTQEPPFSGDAESVLDQHQNSEPPSPRDRRSDLDLSDRAHQLVLKALAKSSSRRHLTLRQFLREVDGLSKAPATPAAEPNRDLQSFETPLHGMTSLKGGDRPPSSEYAPVQHPPADEQYASKLPPADPADTVPAPTVPAPTAPPAGTAAPTAVEVPAPVAPAPDPVTASVPVAPTSPSSGADLAPKDPADSGVVQPEVAKAGAVTVAGEMAGGARVSMKQTSEQAPVKPREEEQAQQQQQQPPADGAKGKPGFRETMWFFKGEIESAMAESGEPQEAVEEETQDLANKYADDGSLTTDEAKRLSLRTGKTQMMQAVKVPSGQLPGEKMNEQEFIGAMNQGKKIGIIVGVVLLIAIIGGVLAAVL